MTPQLLSLHNRLKNVEASIENCKEQIRRGGAARYYGDKILNLNKVASEIEKEIETIKKQNAK